jgi:DNA invertase Pin-like site-specific DNA recombinase
LEVRAVSSKPATTAQGVPNVAYSYLRFSSHGQADGDSIRRQTVNPEAWCQRNGVRLDTSLVFEDRSRSAFKKHHKHREALTEFRRYVAEGRIRPGSYLIIENLDRLSREQERIAVELLLSIVNAGITVVQLMPEEQVFSPTNLDMLGLMRAVIQMAQAHQESAKKAKRLGEVWGEKRKAAIAGTGLLTSRVPGWLDLVDGKLKLNPERAATVRRIFKLCLQGHGGQATARLLNKEKVPTLTGRGKWYQSAVTYILRSRAVVGEHQPHTVHGHEERVAVGEPIKGYYPAVVTEETYDAAQAAMNNRITLAGRPPATRKNIFRGMLRDARNGRQMGIVSRKNDGKRTVVYANNDAHAGEKTYSFPVDVLEGAVLSHLREIDPREVLGESVAGEQVLALTGERDKLLAKINRTAEALGDDDSPTIAAKIRAWESQLRELDDRLTLARQEAANPLANAWGELPGLVELAKTEEGRVRLAAVLRRIASSVWCLFLSRGRVRVAAVQMWFTGEEKHRDWLIYSRPSAPIGSGAGRKMSVPKSGAKSFVELGLPAMDLRSSTNAAKLEKIILAIDPSTFESPTVTTTADPLATAKRSRKSS